MIRKLLATTALTAAFAVGTAFADDAATSNTKAPDQPAPVFKSQINTQTPDENNINGYLKRSANEVLASSLIGKSIYNGVGANAEAVGDVNDIVMSKDGLAVAVVIGVGGFLGVGEKSVAVSFDRLAMSKVEGETWLTISSTKEELEHAPPFDKSLLEGESADTAAVTTSSGTDMAVFDSTVTADQPMDADTPVTVTAGASKGLTGAESVEDMAPVDTADLSAGKLLGTAVMGSNEEELGEVSDVLLAGNGENVTAYIVDVGGFLGVGEKKMAFAADGLKIFKDTSGEMHIYTSATKSSLENKPEFTEQAYEANPDSVLVQ
ncbi:PRC-barrel domain-containing protein [Roseibium litorale]|uniref:PRC-barrel domain-containing protein n=1 Tax=Roseibium litorale TaxID=2803841 RepID=A0ABR9CRF5_9HYPH|nr:PRC-barrel domain-containing protein [Roseibium litorale]MBD8892857.1 PRC-barrel domain-containing protein [Roseibium litorale]